MSEVFYCYYHSPIGKLLMLAKDNMLTNLDLEAEQSQPHPQWQLNKHLPLFQQVTKSLDHYFQGEVVDFANIPINPQGTDFQKKIWKQLSNIPYGCYSSYGELATLIQNPKAVRAVGGAVGRNPISIIIPCHRILGKHGELTGFGGGLNAKRYLLNLEKIPYLDKGVEWVRPKLLKKYHDHT